jgi:AcrR family transcriptional regulator
MSGAIIAGAGVEPAVRPVRSRGARYAQQRERIINAATILMNRRGVRGMTLGDVAQALDQTTTSVTYYFRYKDQLAAAVFDDTLNQIDAMIAEAAAEPTPRERIAKYLGLNFGRHAQALLGKARPLGNLSEIRALEEENRARLTARFQELFRGVRGFFGAPRDDLEKALFGARAQMFLESMHWSVIWLNHYSMSDFYSVAGRLYSLLETGIAAPGASWTPTIIDPGDAGEVGGSRAAFLPVATRLINEFGHRGASIERIVAELNLTKGAFYHHLSAKDDMVFQCLRQSYRRLMYTQRLADETGKTQWEGLASGIASLLHLQFDGDYPLLRTTAFQALPDGVRESAVERSHRVAHRYAGALVEGMQEGSIRIVDPMIASHLIMSTVNAAYDMRSWASNLPRDEAVRIYASTLMHGLFDDDPAGSV